jgi:hypothetical protein
MLDWIASFTNRWLAPVGQAVVDLVHWTVHALASVVYFVFGAVGKAWDNVWGALGWQLTAAAQFVDSVYQLARKVLKVYFPAVYSWIAKETTLIRNTADAWYHDALHAVDLARHEAAHLIDDLRSWVQRDIWAPLVADTRQLRADLQKWGYTAWWYITHPDALAKLLLTALIAAAESAIWQISGPVLTFATKLILANIRRIAILAEDVFTSVF